MARRPRSSCSAHYFHVVNHSVRKATLFQRPRDYRAFLQTLREGLEHHPARLLAYCAMPNHWHLVMGPIDPKPLSKLMHWVTVTHAVRWHRHHQTTGLGPVYQGRYKLHPLEGMTELVRTCRYVERNALCERLVTRAQDWPWGSLSERLNPILKFPIAATPFLASAMWVDYVNTPLGIRETWQERSLPRAAEAVENRSDPLGDVSDDPRRLAGRVERGRKIVGARRGRHEDESHAHVERAEHLSVGDPARALQPGEDRRHRPAVTID